MRHISKLLVLAGLGVVACGGGGTVAPPPPPPPPPPPAPVASVSVSPAGPLSLQVGGTSQLSATPKDASGNALSRAVTWSSSAEAVASVSASGLVTAAAAGTAQIIATSEGITGQATLTVTPVPVATVTLSATTGNLVPNQPFALTATTKDAQGNTLTGRVVTWTSSAEGIATVTAAGLVTGVAVGTANITALSEGKSVQAAITVVDGGWITSAGGTVTAGGGNLVLDAPAGAVPAGPGLAIVVTQSAPPPMPDGYVAGTGYLLNPAGTQFAQPLTVRIKYAAASVPAGLDPAQLRMRHWSGTTLFPVPGHSVNLATRIVTGKISSFSGVIVGGPPAPVDVKDVLFNPASANLTVGQTRQFTAVILDHDGNGVQYHSFWTTDDPTVATVSSSGLVTGITAGTTTLRMLSGTGSAVITVSGTVTPAFAWTAFAGGSSHNCGLTGTGETWCWGYGTYGQLGHGLSVNPQLTPVLVLGSHVFTRLTGGYRQTCGLLADGKAYCWGEGDQGQVGDGTFITKFAPVAVSGGNLFSTLTAGDYHTCGLSTGNDVLCWGDNVYGSLGVGGNTDRNVPTAIASILKFKAIASRTFHTCAVTVAGAAYCWGYNAQGQIGDGTFTLRSTPTAVGGGMTFDDIAVGVYHSCGLTPAGAAWCWGANSVFLNGPVEGMLGNGTNVNSFLPVAVSGNHVFVKLVGGYLHTCGLTSQGETWCWGFNSNGQLGDGSTTARWSPVKVAGGLTFTALTSGGYRTCGITTSGGFCWGWNIRGQVGDGTEIDRLIPTAVMAPN